jgi:hypothetical protein
VLRKASVLSIAFIGGARLARRNFAAHPGTPRFDGVPRLVVFRVLLLEVGEHVLGAVGGPEHQ